MLSAESYARAESSGTGISVDAAAPARQIPAPKPAGFVIQGNDPNYALRFEGFLHLDGRFFTASEGTNTFLVRRARLDLRAKLGEVVSLRLQPDFAQSTLTLLEAYVGLRFAEQAELRGGKFKPPLGLELLQPSAYNLFPEAGLTNLLIPNRDVGIELGGELFQHIVEYAVGVFNGVPDGTNPDIDTNDAKELAGRVFLTPFAATSLEPLKGLGIGISASTGNEEGALAAHRTPGRATFFTYADGVTADGRRVRVVPQAYYYVGPIGVLGEYVRNEARVTDGTATTEIPSTAWQVWGSVVLGGKPGYKGTSVPRPLSWSNGGWGAVELAARLGRLIIDSDVYTAELADPSASARKATNLGIAVSYWLLKGSRLQLGYDRTTFEGGAPNGNRPTEGVVVARLQASL